MNTYPSNTIREKYDEIAELCRNTEKPVFLTENDKIELAVMDIDTYKKLIRELKLREDLLETEKLRHRKRGVYLNSFKNTLYDYEMLCGKNEFHRLLNEGIESSKKGQGIPAEEVFADIEKEFGFGKV